MPSTSEATTITAVTTITTTNATTAVDTTINSSSSVANSSTVSVNNSSDASAPADRNIKSDDSNAGGLPSYAWGVIGGVGALVLLGVVIGVVVCLVRNGANANKRKESSMAAPNEMPLYDYLDGDEVPSQILAPETPSSTLAAPMMVSVDYFDDEQSQ